MGKGMGKLEADVGWWLVESNLKSSKSDYSSGEVLRSGGDGRGGEGGDGYGYGYGGVQIAIAIRVKWGRRRSKPGYYPYYGCHR